jgi:hypothetical protein
MKKIIIGAIIGAIIVSVVALVVGKQSVSLGADGDTNLTNLVLEGDLTVDDDATISGRSLVVTTTNTSTSTVQFGCWQTYATSTASPVKIQATTTGAVMVPVFGTCP